MAEKIDFDPGFSTALVEPPRFALKNDTLHLEIVDETIATIGVAFHNVVALTWHSLDDLSDGGQELVNSDWLLAHTAQGIIAAREGHKHYVFNFSMYGTLEVICTGFEILPKQTAVDG